jgi:predicted ATPase
VKLPQYVTPIVGRKRAIADVEGAIQNSRVVTIVGAGGIGKTRLAVELCKPIAARDAKAVCFIDLEQLVDPVLVAPAIAATLGAELRGGTDPIAAIVSLIQEQTLLIVLDNCEQVARQVARLAAMLIERCPNVRVLATSRERLRVRNELVYNLDSLDDGAAVRLFRERAKQAGDSVALADSETPVVLQICLRLDNIPLAIELAAARVRSDTPKTLLARLKERFRWRGDVKPTGRRHHRTLQSLIDWSFDQLGERAKNVFIQTGVFSGEFTLEAAQAVVGDADEIGELVEKSLIVSSEQPPGRYRMLESVREYALVRLRESADEENVRRKHAEFFAATAAQLAADFGVLSEESWRGRYEPDLDNFRAALSWSQRHEHAMAAVMLGNLKEFWFQENLISEGLSRSQVVLGSLPLDDDRALGPLLSIAILAWRAGENRTSLDAALRALSIATRCGDAPAIAAAHYSLGWALFKSGETERAVAEMRQGVEAYRALDDAFRTLLAEIDYGIALKRSAPERGRELLKQALPIARVSGWPRAVIRIETGLAEYEFLAGNVGIAVELGRQVLASARSGRSGYVLAVALVNLTQYLSVAGDAEEARDLGTEALSIGRSYGIRIAVEWALQSLALVLAEQGEFVTAARILGHVDAFADEVDVEREPTETSVRAHLYESLSAGLERSVLDAELAAGRALTMDQACWLAANAALP